MPDNDPRYEIDIPEIKALLLGVASYLHENCPKGFGFALQLFEFKGEAFFYFSNANREDMIKALREFINRQQ
jgi:hypothetical protein